MEIIGWILAFVIAITVHEAAHAWMADRLGDPTARLMGRLSLNPLVHYDRVGTTLLLVLVFLRALSFIPGFESFKYIIPFGWAKPVQFDPYNLRNPRRDAGFISLAGPASNIVFAVILSLILRLPFSPFSGIYPILLSIFVPIIILNISLALFNIIPINPLDGGKIFIGFLPEKEAREAEIFLQRYGIILLLFLIFPTIRGESPLSIVFSPVINFLIKLLIPGMGSF